MKTLNWKHTHTGWFAKNFILTMDQQIIGQLSFSNIWGLNATYTDPHTQLNFAQKSFWDRGVSITKGGKIIGEIHSGVFGEKTLKLLTGERFIISTSFWEQEVYWKTEEDETIIKYRQATMSSMEKGSISLKEPLPIEKEKLLISSGLYTRQMGRRRRARIMAALILIIAAGSRF